MCFSITEIKINQIYFLNLQSQNMVGEPFLLGQAALLYLLIQIIIYDKKAVVSRNFHGIDQDLHKVTSQAAHELTPKIKALVFTVLLTTIPSSAEVFDVKCSITSIVDTSIMSV